MKRILSLLFMLLPMAAFANTEKPVEDEEAVTSIVEKALDKKFRSSVKVDFCSSLNGTFTGNEFDGMYFKLNRVRLDIRGKISDNFSFRVRESFNKSFSKASLDNVPAALEYANIQWHPNSTFKLTVGKQFLALGGYEALANSMYVREFSDFNDNLSFYRVGVTADMKLADDQTFSVQVMNNRSGKDSEQYKNGFPDGLQSSKLPFLASVCWNGYFADKAWNLIYGASAGPVAKGKNIYYLTCGNIYEKGPIFAYLDVMYSREAIDNQQRISSLTTGVTALDVEYLSFIGRFDYRFHQKWNAYVKGAYETANVVKSNGPFAAGHYITNWNAQACVEWYPFTNDKGFRLFAHYVYKGYIMAENAAALFPSKPDTQRVSLGLIYVIPIL